MIRKYALLLRRRIIFHACYFKAGRADQLGVLPILAAVRAAGRQGGLAIVMHARYI